ncbi:unnamed protein product [Helicobacter felis ATCC 49179]|uniref:Uncharacterized protein n=1 Tax=Helicobacter felis (strain ATCC 49179 / CCUG 28539 / NCTC 12436 / CS1) TaxID=936155 RepID=E7AA17_HELFC|nr:unnamed protein product [Helicobacter felis ATCC 49179]
MAKRRRGASFWDSRKKFNLVMRMLKLAMRFLKKR